MTCLIFSSTWPQLHIYVSLGLINPETAGCKYWVLDSHCPLQSDGDVGGKEQSPWFADRKQYGTIIHCQLIGMYYKEMFNGWAPSLSNRKQFNRHA